TQDFVFKGSLRSSLYRILRKKVFFINSQQQLVILDTLTPRNHISPIIKSVSFLSFDIEPIPHLDISDTFSYLNQLFIIIGIHYSNSHTTIHADQYSPQISAPVKIEQSVVASQPLKPLFAPSETQAKRGETTDSLLAQLHPLLLPKLNQLAEEVRTEMGDDFQTIVITSVQRSVASQVHILSQKMRRLSGTDNMFDYYEKRILEKVDDVRKIGKSTTLNYLNAIQSYFDDTILETLDTSRWAKIPSTHQKQIETMGEKDNSKESEIEVINYKGEKEFKTPRTLEAEKLLTSYMTNDQKGNAVFRPSLHLLPKESVSVMDISIHGNRRDTAQKLLDKVGSGYLTDSEGEPHVHLTLLKFL
ncbi:MAG: hypothetical protein ACRC0X_05110, partial [Brevinema sp.]